MGLAKPGVLIEVVWKNGGIVEKILIGHCDAEMGVCGEPITDDLGSEEGIVKRYKILWSEEND